MTVGVLSVTLLMRQAHSLKEKRGMIKRIKARLRRAFNVSVAEVGGHDKWQKADLSIVAVSNERQGLEGMLCKILDGFKRTPVPELLDFRLEFFSQGHAGLRDRSAADTNPTPRCAGGFDSTSDGA